MIDLSRYRVSLIVLAVLIAMGCNKPSEDSDTFDRGQKSELLSAIAEGNVSNVNEYLSKGTDPNALQVPQGKPYAGAYPLHLATAIGNSEIVEILLKSGADVEKPAYDENGGRPLHWAVFFQEPESVKLLLDYRASLTSKDNNGTTPLDLAALLRSSNFSRPKSIEKIARIELLFSGKDAAVSDVKGPISLIDAIYVGEAELVREVLLEGLDSHHEIIGPGLPFAGAYPLHLAAALGHREIVEILLDHGAKIEQKAQDKDGAPPIHWAVFFIQETIVDLLLERGALANSESDKGTKTLDLVLFLKALNRDALVTMNAV